MSSDLIICHKTDAVWTLTLNRAGKANALSTGMLRSLNNHFTAAGEDRALRALIITGAGERVFCAGADLTESKGERDKLEDLLWDEVSDRLNSLPLLTLALINGHCIGGAMTLALGCDIRVSVPQASFSYPVLQNGILPGSEDATRMRALIGSGRTSALLLGAQKIDAERAEYWGLVDYVVERDQLMPFGASLIQEASQAQGEHLARMKRLCRGA